MENQEILVEYLESFLRLFRIPAQISKESSIESMIETLVQGFQQVLMKETKLKSDLHEILRQKEIEIKQYSEDLQTKEKIIESQKTSISRLQIQIENLENKFKKDLQRVADERDSAKKELIKIASVENQFKHELKKKDIQFAKIQNQLRKSLSEKDFSYRNPNGEISIFNDHCSKNSVAYEEFYKFLKTGHSDLENQMILINQNLSGLINQIFKSVEHIMNVAGFQVNWKPLDLNMVDFIAAEVEFRLNDFENCMKNLRKFRDIEGSSEEIIFDLKTIIDGYKNIIDSNFVEAMRC